MFCAKTLATSFLYHLSLALAASLSSLSQVLSLDKPSSNAFITNNSSNLNAPIPRPGFRAAMRFNESVALRPLEIYENTIHLMKTLSEHGWNGYLENPIIMSSSRDPQAIQVSIYPLKDPDNPTGFLETDIAVSGLYQAGIAIANRNAFYKLDAFLYVGDHERGKIIVYPKWKQPLENNLSTIDNLSTEPVGPSPTNTRLTADRGRLTDPKDEKFVITFRYDGTKIQSADVFTSILNFFAIAAQHENTGPNAYVPAAPSAAGEVVLSTWTMGEEKERQLMTWERLKRGVLMTWGRVVMEDGGMGKKPRFEGWEIGFEYAGVMIGGGRLLRFDASGGRAIASF